MIALIKTETVYFNTQAEVDTHVTNLQASGNLDPGAATGIKMSGFATKATSVSGRPAIETYVTANLPQLQCLGA